MDRDCLQAMGWPCLTFSDCLNLHFACRDKIGTGQNRPFYPCFGPHRGNWSSKNWFGMAHQVVRYVIQPSWPHSMQQKKRSHLYNGGESVFFGRTPIRGINQHKQVETTHHWMPNNALFFSLWSLKTAGREFPEGADCNDVNDNLKKRLDAIWQKFVDADKEPVFMDILDPSYTENGIKFDEGYHFACLRLEFENCSEDVHIVYGNA